LPRDLDDVLHFFLPIAEESEPRTHGPSGATAETRPVALPILSVPVASRDVVRAAFSWNLTVELARLGARATLVVPHDPSASALWPPPGRGPLGARMVPAAVGDVAALTRVALDIAIAEADGCDEGGVVVVCTPPAWLIGEGATRALLRWLLLLATPDVRDLQEAYALAKLAYQTGSQPLVGLVIHGVRRMRDAELAFARVADAASRHLGRTPVSYGLLADDLHVYRAIASQRPIGLEHPQSRAARALRDVARMLWEDARKLLLV
jgi:hypothetical protein